MCGIVGLISNNRIKHEILSDMAESIKHRGPDDIGYFIEGNVGLGHTRLSILDLNYGRQPMTNEDGSVVVIFNGEIFNYLELREVLKSKCHVIDNNSDTAILPHMYEQFGLQMFEKLNGQFAIAIWDKNNKKFILARDRMGEKPLYYYSKDETFCFASEVKAIFKSGLVKPSISPIALKQVFTYWSTLNDRSAFEDIYSIPTGCFLVFQNKELTVTPYWQFRYDNSHKNMDFKDINLYVNEFDLILRKAIERRMLADVPISFYLSGGLDSSIITSMAANICGQKLNTFSITFEDKYFDESEYQKMMSNYLLTNHCEVKYSMKELPLIIKEVIRQTETPILRTGVFPMYLLAKLVRSNNKKVVLSGEGSDELFGGYDIFREVKIREFCNRNPDSKIRNLLYKKVNNYVKGINYQPANSLSMFYNSSSESSHFDSHMTRWRMGKYFYQFFSNEFQTALKSYNEEDCINDVLYKEFDELTSVQKAQYLEIMIFLPNYLLSSQGDRVSMAHGVECRYPFLDNEVIDFATSIPDNLKIKVLNEKYILKKLAQKYIPNDIINRKKFPYRAPINISELLKDEYIAYVISKSVLKEYGVFNAEATERYLLSLSLKQNISEKDVMLFLGILTTQILVETYKT